MPIINVDSIDVDDDERHFLHGKPFTGEVIETDGSGAVVERYGVREGWEDGLQLSWYPDGQLKARYTSHRRRPIGTSHQWYDNGQLAEERRFDERGRLMWVRRWDKDGSVLDGGEQPSGEAGT